MAPSRPSKSREKSPSTTPVPTTEQTDGSQLPDAQWEAMSNILNFIYDFRVEDDAEPSKQRDPSKLFQRLVNKRHLPDYYQTIKEPIAMSGIKTKIHGRAYRDFAGFVRDWSLIIHNAQLFNIPNSQAFQDSLTIKEQIEKQLQLLVKDGLITQEVATLPDMGEIPEHIPPPVKEGEGEDDEESDDEADEDDDEEGEEEDDDGKRKRRRGRPTKRDTVEDADGKRARGRPPKLLTPLEGRILAILKGIRKPKNKMGQLMIRSFDRLPDKAVMPEYYNEIKNPIAYDQLKRKAKRKKYKTLEDFMADVNLIFNNAKSYNEDESQIYKDAVALQIEAGRLYDDERAKPDESFADDEGKIPMPTGVFINGENYVVGDWIHLQNPNDLTKPIPAQIYRTYRDSNGQQMINVCWYYRPEQTIHRYDKHFFPAELVKTGRYRDHRVEEIEGRCFIMFYTRYFKGRPRGLAPGTEVYVCQARYNEAAPAFNIVKTWASCLPDEVRDKDYEMDLFEQPRRMKKVPSPIAYLLKDDQKETDDFPKATWGAEGAPPKIGAVHRRPRTEKDSPPPEPTPPPPPKLPTPPPRAMPPSPVAYRPSPQSQPAQVAPPRPLGGPSAAYTPARPQQTAASTAPPRPLSAQQSQHTYTPSTPLPPASAAARPPAPSHQSSYQPSNAANNPSSYNVSSSAPPVRPQAPPINYRDPPPVEVYTLPESANWGIPREIREQYQRDEIGRVLFFTTPPVDIFSEVKKLPNHSVRYLAEKARRKEILAKKRKDREADRDIERARAEKKIQLDEEQQRAEVDDLRTKALEILVQDLRGLGGQV